MKASEQLIRQCVAEARGRTDMWIRFLRAADLRRIVEIGVYRGDLAEALLRDCAAIERYYMIDPWRHLADWNKPANEGNGVFERLLAETLAKTEFAAAKRTLLRGKTVEVIDEIRDGELDFAYIDGDHTLKGITIDLIRVLSKVRVGGWIGGDDFCRVVWQHQTHYEPTLVFPFAVFFAEAVGAHIYALPHSQFLIEKSGDGQFAFVDLVGHYADVGLSRQLRPSTVLRRKMIESFPWLAAVVRRNPTRRRSRSARPS